MQFVCVQCTFFCDFLYQFLYIHAFLARTHSPSVHALLSLMLALLLSFFSFPTSVFAFFLMLLNTSAVKLFASTNNAIVLYQSDLARMCAPQKC